MAATRKPSTRKKTTGKKTAQRETVAAQHAKKQMWAVVLFALGLLLGALTWITGDKLWLALHNFLYGMFGWSVWFLAPCLIYIAVIAAMDKPLSSIKAKLWQAGILLVLLSAAIQIFGGGLPDEGSFIANIQKMYRDGIAMKGGGLVSGLIAVPLLSLLAGPVGAKIIIVLGLFVFVMLVTGSTLLTLYKTASKPVKSIEKVYTTRVAERADRRDERQMKKPDESAKASPRFNIDVDISKDEQLDFDPDRGEVLPSESGMPAHPVIAARPDPGPSEDEIGLDNAVPFPVFGVDSPVEYISPDEFNLQPEPVVPREPEPPQAVRAHPLDEDIRLAEKQEGEGDISDIVDRYINTQGMAMDTGAADIVADPPLSQGEFGPMALEREPAQAAPDADPFADDDPVVELPPAAAPPLRLVPGGEQAAQPKATSSRTASANSAPIPAMEIPMGPVKGDAAEPSVPAVYQKPSVELLKPAKSTAAGNVSEELKGNAQRLVDTLKSFGVQTRITDICRGPTVTRYELQPSAGVKISKITNLADDIALNLAASGIRIEAPIPNKPAVGIEVPNKTVSMVSIREIIDSKEFESADSSVSVALGKDIAGNIMLADIAKMPHVLIAGATGSGKSVCINSIICSLLFKSSPDEVKLLMVDPKVVELGIYNGIPHLLVPVVTDPKKAAGALNWAVKEMLDRYKAFADNSVRDLAGYNRLAEGRDDLRPMPKIVIIIDELADLMMAAPGDVEDAICRLAQMARAAGMHLVIATQRPSVDVITGVIKANIPSRIAFAVSSQVDSRTILDMGGAEKLLGRGDMLFYPVGASKPLRVQGCFVTDTEVEQVVDFVKNTDAPEYDQSIADEIDRQAVSGKGGGKDSGGGFDDEDEMLPQAIECVVEAGQASTSQLQRRLKLGYARAARITDQLEQKGIIGPSEGSKPRQVLISKDRWIEMKLSGAELGQLSAQANAAPTPEPVFAPERGTDDIPF